MNHPPMSLRAAVPTAVAFLALFLATPSPAANVSPWVGRPLPEVAWKHPLRDATGRVRTLSEWKGQRLVVNFWATWCGPCREEMPRLARLHGALQSRGGIVVAISLDRDPVQVSQFLMNQAESVPAVIDGPEGLAKGLDLKQLPLTWLVDESGRIVDEVAGGSATGLDRLAGRALTPTVGASAAAAGAVAEGEGAPR